MSKEELKAKTKLKIKIIKQPVITI